MVDFYIFTSFSSHLASDISTLISYQLLLFCFFFFFHCPSASTYTFQFVSYQIEIKSHLTATLLQFGGTQRHLPPDYWVESSSFSSNWKLWLSAYWPASVGRDTGGSSPVANGQMFTLYDRNSISTSSGSLSRGADMFSSHGAVCNSQKWPQRSPAVLQKIICWPL